ncbi:chromosome segregation protein SMC [Methylotetracoccus oryzae]|uniref:chromosome segregation protein SMC n=1 Tax=Methylotetracoccus oryzae TaxID=1919059 RepID=UPI001119398C|nr:chromosome segregation protein SMC [Methylotetracoccus oryzae]
MRLEKIKLAGFKSFVDPTTLPLPGNLVGVVGPNGCGKSNIIDAVRWVMGESSAKHLRGDTMADVVFNGSSTRKPVGVASVELLFDNTDGRATAEYAGYQKIAIKRQVGRDGQSTYLLNGSRCRRKDITDLFLGTGLGARSYAIIEQGTISRLIEAKPDELRGIVEEAAGISRYKERRHETEIRMRHTRENLERVDDLRGELTKQVESLQRQVKKAERYLALRDEERRSRSNLLRLRWQASRAAMTQLHTELEGLGAALREAVSAGRESGEKAAEWQLARERRQSEMQEVQASFYEVGADIGRLEDLIRRSEKSREETVKDLQRLEAETQRAGAELQHDRAQLAEVRRELVELAGILDASRSTAQAATARKEAAGQGVRAARIQLEAVQSRLAQAASRTEIIRARDRQLGEQQRQTDVRWQRLADERRDLEAGLGGDELESLRQTIAEEEALVAEHAARVEELTGALKEGRTRLEEQRLGLNSVRAEIHTAQGRLSSLELLQQHAMGKDRAAVQAWLAQLSLDQAPRLAERLDVGLGWEAAVEEVLGQHLEALCIDSMQPFLNALVASPPQESLAFFETCDVVPRSSPQDKALPRLLDQVAAPWRLEALLSGVFCAPDLSAAVAAGAWLEDHESVVTQKGERLGRGWVRLQKAEDARSGVIRREREVRQAKDALQRLLADEGDLAGKIATLERELSAAEEERLRHEQERRRLERSVLELRNAEHQLNARQQQALKRLAAVTRELEEAEALRVDLAEQRAEAGQELRETGAAIDAQTAEVTVCRELLADAEEAWTEAERIWQLAQDELRRLESRDESLRSNERLTASHLERAEAHATDADLRLKDLRERFEDQPLVEAEKERLAELRSERERLESLLADHRGRLGDIDKAAREAAEERLRHEREIERIKERLERTRIELEGHQVREDGLREQLTELGLTVEVSPDAGEGGLTAEAGTEAELQQAISRLAQDIEKLGPVNLLAVEEFADQKARLDLLEQQRADLNESLEILMQAIEKIDRECRALFKGTFERINSGFQVMFPKLFGGGNAYLELNERDLLEAGVSVIARPPGKRNSSIHLLSGGEKALTAVALVFAIFELNPAPFCLLDEVDAPLDDANVGRFSALVKEMSERVQFLFITHNKVTMEIADYLAGITMREPGVSRIVAVDIEAAVELANA